MIPLRPEKLLAYRSPVGGPSREAFPRAVPFPSPSDHTFAPICNKVYFQLKCFNIFFPSSLRAGAAQECTKLSSQIALAAAAAAGADVVPMRNKKRQSESERRKEK